MSGKSSGASTRSGVARSNAGKRSVRQAEYAEHREAVNDRLDAIEDSTAENGGRLEKIEEMLGHLQDLLDDIQANQDAVKLNRDQGQHNGAASARGSVSDKLWLKERVTAWENPDLRAFWILCGEKPKGCELSRVQLQGVFKNTALASSAVVEQVNVSAGLDVTAFIPRGAEPGTAGTIDIEKQLAILAKVLLLVIGRDITSVGEEARVEKLRAAFQDGVDMVTSHGEANHQAIQMPVNKARIARFINKDLKDWSIAVHNAALSAKSNWHEPPGIDELPGAVVSHWAKIGAYIDAGGRRHSQGTGRIS